MTIVMKQQMAAGEFKSHCLQILDQVRDSRTEVIITKRGKPVAKLVPVDPEEPEPIFGRMRGTVKIHGDIVGPTGEVWDADR